MAVDHPALLGALGSCRAHIILVEYFEQRAAGQAPEKGGLDEGQGQRWQEEVIDSAAEIGTGAIDREPAEIEGKGDQQ
jgi:hypothetical protein